MFTGLIEEVGLVKGIKSGEKSSRILIKAKDVLESTKIGDSISTNGVCLTVTKLYNEGFEADVMSETLIRSNLSSLSIGESVNLERAMTLENRFGGHIVSGHVDGVGKITNVIKEDNAVWLTIEIHENIAKYIIEKGSIAIDGISLTVAYVDRFKFKVSIIPHTRQKTTLLNKKIGDVVNIECDIIGKYVEKLICSRSINNEVKSKVTLGFLSENGFL